MAASVWSAHKRVVTDIDRLLGRARNSESSASCGGVWHKPRHSGFVLRASWHAALCGSQARFRFARRPCVISLMSSSKVRPSHLSPPPSGWWLYLLECDDGSFYLGITANIDRRLREHLSGRGCNYTRHHTVARLVGCIPALDRAHATRTEKKLKRLTMLEKIRHFESNPLP